MVNFLPGNKFIEILTETMNKKLSYTPIYKSPAIESNITSILLIKSLDSINQRDHRKSSSKDAKTNHAEGDRPWQKLLTEIISSSSGL